MSLHVIGDPAQVREIMRRTDDFAPSNALTSVVPLAPATLRILSKARFALPPILASATGERHRAVRTMVARFFTPAKVAAIGPRVRELTQARLATSASALAGTSATAVDLADTVARYIPPVIMAELTGVPIPELGLLKRWSQDSLELFWGWPDPDRQLVLARSAADFYEWLQEQAVAARGTDSLFGVLDQAGLSLAEVCSLGYFLGIAGQETTSLLINTALYRGIENKGHDGGDWASLANPHSAAAHVRQVLTTESSVHTWRRAALRQSVLDGAVLPAGAEILLELSGQHPKDASPTAYTLAFGYGLHRCLGARLAELETALVVEETARLLPHVVLAGPEPQWLRLLSFQAPLSVSVKSAVSVERNVSDEPNLS
ncbi:cytochrome P450 [Arthrobacter cryoconiti]|uniref:Cytochrome P450 n=1 Tax=Arthrobacter cryoconiti TaxID=748907 RepID=A0ABV8R1L2_9MICC|nr:cytochrome P450 [Arthrobacter cryoconiti]MCC9068241.1 cytochrome P450 [Arthrobacter cryoconiti]